MAAHDDHTAGTTRAAPIRSQVDVLVAAPESSKSAALRAAVTRMGSVTALALLGTDRTRPAVETDGGAAVFRVRRRHGRGALSRPDRNRFRVFARQVTTLGYRRYVVRFAGRPDPWVALPSARNVYVTMAGRVPR